MSTTSATASPSTTATAAAKPGKTTAAAAASAAAAKSAAPRQARKKAAPPPATSASEKKAAGAQAAPKDVKAKAAKPFATEKASADTKTKKPKLVRDSFTIPKDEYAAIDALKQRAATLGHPVKKSELLRAGLKLLVGLSDTALRSAVQAVPSIKTGRPKAADAAAPQPAPAAKATRK